MNVTYTSNDGYKVDFTSPKAWTEKDVISYVVEKGGRCIHIQVKI